jgi:XTP/dITP diphosphohydrolase
MGGDALMASGERTIVIASANAHKIEEMAAILDLPDARLRPCADFGIGSFPPEDAPSFIGNALIKARHAHGICGHATIADDSGLVVDALDGAPGVRSARFAGSQADDAANNAKLLELMAGLAGEERKAYFACAIAFIDEDGAEAVVEGRCEGRIALAPSGDHGFGYDPLFIPDGNDGQRSFAELGSDEKNAISHRSKALKALRDKLSCAPAVEAATPATMAASAATATPAASDGQKVSIVAFDLDGTLIDAASPVRLVNRLARDRIMSPKAVAKISLWGMRYKMGAELDQSLPRSYIFGSFTDFPATDANSIMVNLYNEEIRRLVRPDAAERIAAHKAAGDVVILVSASFEPMVCEVVREFGLDGWIATRMEVVDGYYTGRTIGEAPEGRQKLLQLTDYANERFGEGCWQISWAYGDHFSDIPLLNAAANAVAVDPDRRLERYARAHGWEVVEWPLP